MDVVTHALAGASLGVALAGLAGARRTLARPADGNAARGRHLAAAAFAGALGGVLPDLDVLVRSERDPLLVLEAHRHVTHALMSVPLVALLALGLLRLCAVFWRRLGALKSRWLYAFALIGAAHHGALDACTSYGTHLLWPFTDSPVAWNLIAVVDPLFSLALLAGLALALAKAKARFAWAGLALAAGYLIFAAHQQSQALEAARDLAAKRRLVPEHVLAKPTLGNLLLWRTLARTPERIYADGVHVSPWGGVRIYRGTSEARFTEDSEIDWAPPGSAARRDVERFRRLSDDWLAIDPRAPERIGDARYAMLPTLLEPLWGIAPGEGDAPIQFVVVRELPKGGDKELMRMLRGQPLDETIGIRQFR